MPLKVKQKMSEAEEQKQIIEYFQANWPEYRRCLRVSLAGLNFGSGRRGSIMKNHVRSQGIQDGESDILIALARGNFGALVIEHKKADALRGATDSQLDYIRFHNSIGNLAMVTKGPEMAIAAIDEYMALGPPKYL